MKLRPTTRAVVYDPKSRKMLLVRTYDESFWHPPGGGWEYDRETVVEGAVREVAEETGLKVRIIRLLYTQQFQATPKTLFIEWMWLAHPVGRKREVKKHKDTGGDVGEARWFTEKELQPLTVYPRRLKTSFWKNLRSFEKTEDPFIYKTD